MNTDVRTDKVIKSNIFISKIMILIGILVGAAAIPIYIYDIVEVGYFVGIACGLLGGGIGNLIKYNKGSKNPEVYKTLKFGNEERMVFIREKAGNMSFSIIFYVLCALVLFSNIIKLSMVAVSIILLGISIVVHLICLSYFIKKY